MHTIVILAVPGVQLLDIAGPLDVFSEANRITRRRVYHSVVISLGEDVIQSSSGVSVNATTCLSQFCISDKTSFLIAGSPDIGSRELSESQICALTEICQQSFRYGSICTGALLLAQTGLINDRQVTSHWSVTEELHKRFPAVQVNADALYVADGPVRTAAGVTSGMDLAIRFVEEDLGQDIARDVAANLVMFFRRPGGQGHFIRSQKVSTNGRSSLQDLQRWVLTNLESIRGVGQMADYISLSVRHLNRIFQQEMGVSTGDWLEQAKISRARELLVGQLPVKTVAARCGYSSTEVMRRAFIKVTGMSPAVYKKVYGAGQ
ncbi:GlxA family transcriptional regulator [Cedecea sp. P7760]|uniref:GlxA family transcriptional regulator n=1 Tax=Cedecea sp. P7760 TaxID=2726983 RepID=UPI001C430325|nr:helix-turn-helix domain-containing protein [Cedecea sp. P7760]